MDFVIVANAWAAGIDNPTSKHRIALELARRGHRVLWVEGAGMRAPSVGSGSDRLRMARKVLTVLRGARKVDGRRGRVDGRGTSDLRCSSLPLWVLSPLFIPLPKHEAVRRLNGIIGAWSARLWSVLLGFRDPVLINYVPVLAEIMRRWRRARTADCRPQTADCRPADSGAETVTGDERGPQGLRSAVCSLRSNPAARVVYHCVDRWDAFAMYDSAVMAAMDRRCCEYADVVIASAAELRDRCLRWNPNTRLVTHGVDHEHFRSAVDGGQGKGDVPGHLPPSTSCPPPDLPAGPVIGFFGLLSEWVDQALLLRLARALPQAHLVLIGKADVDVAALKGAPNIHVLGPRPFAALPAYLAHFTVGIIPFVVNDLTRAVNPIKLREMLSGGCPVVSSALPEVTACVAQAQVGDDVVVAATADAFEAGVRRFIEAPLDAAARRALSERMRAETWEAKVEVILRIVRSEPVDGRAGRSG